MEMIGLVDSWDPLVPAVGMLSASALIALLVVAEARRLSTTEPNDPGGTGKAVRSGATALSAVLLLACVVLQVAGWL